MPDTDSTLNESLERKHRKLNRFRAILREVREKGFDINEGLARTNLAGFREICDSEIEILLNRNRIATADPLDEGQVKSMYDFVLAGERELIKNKVIEQIDNNRDDLDNPETTKELVSKLLGEMESFYQENKSIFSDVEFKEKCGIFRQQTCEDPDIDKVIPSTNVLTREQYEQNKRESQYAASWPYQESTSLIPPRSVAPISQEELDNLPELTENDIKPPTYTKEQLEAIQGEQRKREGGDYKFFNSEHRGAEADHNEDEPSALQGPPK